MHWVFFFLLSSISSLCTLPKSHQLNAEESILLEVIVFDCHVKFLLPFSRCWYCSFGLVNLGNGRSFWSVNACVPDNEGVMLFIPSVIMEPIRGLLAVSKWMSNRTWISMCTGWNNYTISSVFSVGWQI